jgi:hypothetical protein
MCTIVGFETTVQMLYHHATRMKGVIKCLLATEEQIKANQEEHRARRDGLYRKDEANLKSQKPR